MIAYILLLAGLILFFPVIIIALFLGQALKHAAEDDGEER